MSKSDEALFVLVTHAPLGQALFLATQHVLGKPPILLVADVLDSDLPEPWIDKLVADIRQQKNKQVLLFCDLYGSTPYHIATAVQRQLNVRGKIVHLLSGVNAVMLIKALTDKSPTIEQKIEQILIAASRGIVHQAPSSPTYS